MDEDNLSIFDVERTILTGDIIERQKDQEAGEWKYLVRDHVIDGTDSVVVCKLGATGKMVVIAVYREE
jgi:hypothetical protein